MSGTSLRQRLHRLYIGESRIDFIGNRRRWYAFSGLLLLICALSLIFRGFNVGVEFKGGTQFQITASGTRLTPTQVEDAFSKAGTPPADPATEVGSGGTRSIVVRTETLQLSAANSLEQKVESALKIPASRISYTTVSSSWGSNVTTKAVEGLVVFLIAVSVYISIFYQWRMAVGGIVALLHDLVIAAGIYSVVGFEVTPSTVVGLLTILGFSLYDTVVVYDKVRENSRDLLAGTRMTFSEAANLAVNQTLMRSINTSLIALLPVAGLLFVGAGLLGVGTIKDLALILFVGLASGAYSSLFLATPIVVDLTERQPAYRALTRRVAAKRAEEATRRAGGGSALVGAGATGRGAAGSRAGSGGGAPGGAPGGAGPGGAGSGGAPGGDGSGGGGATAIGASTALPRRSGAPAPAPRPGARPDNRPQRQRRR